MVVVIFGKKLVSKSKIWYPMNLFDIWIPQSATWQKLQATLLRYVFANHESAYWKHVLHWNRKDMTNENPGIQWIVISFAWRLLDMFAGMYRKWKCSRFSNVTVFTICFSSKAWHLPKTLKILFFALYDITYIQHTGNGNAYLELAFELKYYALLFLKSIFENCSKWPTVWDSWYESLMCTSC